MKTLVINIWIIIAIYLNPAYAADANCNRDLSDYLRCNNPIVKQYLSSLSKQDLGRANTGVELTDDRVILNGYTFAGKAKKTDKFTNLYLFRKNDKYTAYVGIEKGGENLIVPHFCEKDYIEASLVLSGDVHTFGYVNPSDVVIQLVCVNEQWKNEMLRSNQLFQRIAKKRAR